MEKDNFQHPSVGHSVSLDPELAFQRSYANTNSHDSSWNLYYSDEGYPYYYNSHTNESVWAQEYSSENNSKEFVSVQENGNSDQIQATNVDAKVESASNSSYDDSDDESDTASSETDSIDSQSDSESDSEEINELNNNVLDVEPKLKTSDLRFDRDFEIKFRAYLRTEEGQAALEVINI